MAEKVETNIIDAATTWKKAPKLKAKKVKSPKKDKEVKSPKAFNVFASQNNLSKSEFIVNRNQGLLTDDDYKIEYLDNNFWRPQNELMSSQYNLDELVKDLMEGEMPEK